MNRSAKVYYDESYAGVISETEEGFEFKYNEEYLKSEKAKAVSLTLPLRKAKYVSKTMFPFFDGLIPEGWLLNIAAERWKVKTNDRMGLLLSVCKDCIGAVSVGHKEENSNA